MDYSLREGDLVDLTQHRISGVCTTHWGLYNDCQTLLFLLSEFEKGSVSPEYLLYDF
jgi:hypothetical protein